MAAAEAGKRTRTDSDGTERGRRERMEIKDLAASGAYKKELDRNERNWLRSVSRLQESRAGQR